MHRMTVVSASQNKANNPAVSSAGTWKLACKRRPMSCLLAFQQDCVLPFDCSCLIKVFLLHRGFIQLHAWFLHYTSLSIRNRCLWISTKGKKAILKFGPGNLATKLRLKVYMKLSPDRSIVPKAERCWVPRSVQTGTKYTAYLLGSLPSFVIYNFQNILLACLFLFQLCMKVS